MKTRLRLAIVAAGWTLAVVAVPGFAQEPIGECPNGFHLHAAMEHHDGEAHHHAGTDADQNGDGWICARHVSADGTVHVHVDNNVSGS